MTIVRLGSVDGALSSSPAETELEAEKIFFRKHILRENVFLFSHLFWITHPTTYQLGVLSKREIPE